ncbi:hypothetical protein BPLS_P5678 [Bathymodiolus platifrons methanotrophic gill symbiont]|uniref:hypothetical protein n=1 Tax=Bathymodiolus platifrons methanotrophic gill symbiont TaxID=113268 RepID=UPI001B4AF6B4|nr:hypothetical protein [Bathymodiolus platifrons methanotrophic gill symbiont]GFO77304.1 hypothetical protein BPLS_P5678 [Bathymodiolus platifrons methanotrophic gill symbiont]
MTDDELKELVASLAVSQKLTDEQIKKTDEQMKRTDEKIERLGVRLGNISRNQGDVAEEFFYNSLIKDNHLGAIAFDDITKNMEKHRGNIQEEYDLFMTNGDSIAIVEVKYKAHINDLDKLDRKFNNFKKLFPIYKDYKLYGALAAFHMNYDAKEEVLKRGYFALQRNGDLICSENSDYLKVL